MPPCDLRADAPIFITMSITSRKYGIVQSSLSATLLVILGTTSLALTPAQAATTTIPVATPVITTTTTVQTDTVVKNDVSDKAIEEIVTVTTTRPLALKTYRIDSTAYNSEVGQCDDSPFITADGSHVRDGIVAANFLPFGTKVRIPSIYGDRVFEVHDRMNARYTYRMDIWMVKKQDARQYGLKRNLLIEVIEWGDGSTQWKKASAVKPSST